MVTGFGEGKGFWVLRPALGRGFSHLWLAQREMGMGRGWEGC